MDRLRFHDNLSSIEEQSMNSPLKSVVIGLALLPAAAMLGATRSHAASLEVMNPRGEIPPPAFHAPSTRVSDLNGKRVGIYWIGKAGGDNFWDGVERLVNEKYPGAKTVRYEGPFDLGDARAAEIAKEVDTMFYGVGD
jgi:hypothetical protein